MFQINIIDLILLIAAVQGIFLTVLVFLKYQTFYANRFLASLILVYTLLLVWLIASDREMVTTDSIVSAMMPGLSLLIPTLHYLYAKFVVQEFRRFRVRYLIYFLLFILYETAQCVLYLGAKTNNAVRFDPFSIFHWLVIVVGYAFMLPTIRVLNRYENYLKEFFSSIEKIRITWLKNITYLATAVLTIYCLETLLRQIGIRLYGNFNISSVLTGIYVYVLGYSGLFKSEVFARKNLLDEINLAKANDQKQEAGAAKYEKSGLSAQKSEQYLQKLLELMKSQKPYKDSELTLQKLATMLNISPHNLSEVINTRLGQNFFDFINQYRVEEVKKHLSDPQKNNFTILSLAFEAGFSSKSTFNQIFKKYTQMTPSEFRKRNASKKQS